jgi:hypothetical protein
MAHDSPNNDLPLKRFEQAPRTFMMASGALTVIGLIALIAALATDAERAWRAYLVNWLDFTSLAMGAVLLAVVVTITRGVWSRSVRRIALSFVAFLPLAYLLMFPLFFAADHIFPWLHEELPAGKEAYLNVPFLAIRNAVALGALFILAFVFAYWSLRPDLGLVRDSADARLRGLYERLTRGWQGQELEEARAHRKLAVLAPVIALVYAVAFSLVSWDFIMSLEPHWFSTLIGPYFFMAAFLGGIAATGLLAHAYTRALGVGEVYTETQRHDLGKLTFAFVVFWAYLLFSQFIVIWYGLLPGEQSFVVHRFAPPFDKLAQAVFACLFVLPFFGLLGVVPKKHPTIYGVFASIILLGLWFERLLLVYPSYYASGDNIPLGWQEIGIGLFFTGLLLFALMAFATRFPLFQMWQPMSELELEGLRVEVEEAVH